MLEELQPLTLAEAARRLGLEPFEVVRLLVASDAMPRGAMMIEPERLATLKKRGGLEDSWWEAVDLPEDKDPRRQRVRAALGLLVSRKHVGASNATRIDNVWRGLPQADQVLLDQAFASLASDGLVQVAPTLLGRTVSVVDGAVAKANSLVGGGASPKHLAEYLAG